VPTPAEAVRGQLTVVTGAVAADLATEAAQVAPEKSLDAVLAALPSVVSTYYDAAAALAVSWYEELRDSTQPQAVYSPAIIGEPVTDWIEREVRQFQQSLEADLEAELQRMTQEATILAEKEVARGFRATIIGNTHEDEEAIGWSRVARPGACKFCTMLAAKGAVYTEATVDFAAHGNCHCATRPEFRNGEHGPEATVEQYLASAKRRTPEQRAALREYLNYHYPDAPG